MSRRPFASTKTPSLAYASLSCSISNIPQQCRPFKLTTIHTNDVLSHLYSFSARMAALEALPSEHLRVFEQHIHQNCAQRLRHICETCEDAKSHFGVIIDLGAMFKISQSTVLSLLNDPPKYLPLLQNALDSVYDELFPDGLKPNLHARVSHIPTMNQWVKPNISILRSTDVGKLISIMGTVTRTGSVALREGRREYVCRRCKYSFELFGDVAQRGAFEVPSTCPNPGEKPCYSSSFLPLAEEGSLPECREYQEIKLQEKVQHLNVGSIPRSIICILTDDLADTVKPGDDVVVSGIVHLQWRRSPSVGNRAEIELMMVAEHVKTSNERKSFMHVTEKSRQAFARHWASRTPRQQLRARDVILRSICPQIYGMYLVKLIVAMTLIGGVPHTDTSGSRIRGESHLLMVGDPGTAKSQFLRYAAKMSPRSVLTTGIGTTSAGLTVTAVREPGTGEWMLDAGALVLADGGICCIDEFDGIKTHDRGAIHEAMEQQTLSIAKAGLVCTMNTRATVMAAVNPKSGRVATEIGNSTGGDEYADDDSGDHLPITVGIAAPLLSRFDVILTLLDQHNEAWDRQLSSFILNDYVDGRGSAQGEEEIWNSEQLKQYIYYVKTNLQPELSDNAMRLLSVYYTKERAMARRNAARTTVRLLEALVRLTQAHARLMFRETATAMDAAFAIAAVESSTVAPNIVGGIGALHATFPSDPSEEFDEFARGVLAKLGLEGDGINFYDDRPVDDTDAEDEHNDDDDADKMQQNSSGDFEDGWSGDVHPNDSRQDSIHETEEPPGSLDALVANSSEEDQPETDAPEPASNEESSEECVEDTEESLPLDDNRGQSESQPERGNEKDGNTTVEQPHQSIIDTGDESSDEDQLMSFLDEETKAVNATTQRQDDK